MAKDSAPTTLMLVVLATVGLLTATYGGSRELAPQSGEGKAGVGGSRAGRHAHNPAQIPAAGWWTVLKRMYEGFFDDRLMTEAAGMTFYVLLAIFPALTAFVSMYGFFGDPSSVNDQLAAISGIFPGGALDIISQQMKALSSGGKQTLGISAVIGLLTSLWSANQGVKGLFDALNVVYHEKEKRGFVWRTVITLTFTLGALVFVILALLGIVVVPIVLTFIGFGSWAATVVSLARWPVLLAALMFFLTLVYRYGPSRRHARWQWVSWGSVFAALVWLVASLAFSFYVANFGSYNKTYGSLGAVIGFMTWIWISSMIVLAGGELNAELEQQTHVDSTVGAPKPIGSRGAYKADVKF